MSDAADKLIDKLTTENLALRAEVDSLRAEALELTVKMRTWKERAKPLPGDVVQLGVTKARCEAWLEKHFVRDESGDWVTEAGIADDDESGYVAPPLDCYGTEADEVAVSETAVDVALYTGRSWWDILDEMAKC